jgi:hypothetical protein
VEPVHTEDKLIVLPSADYVFASEAVLKQLTEPAKYLVSESVPVTGVGVLEVIYVDQRQA